MQRSLKPIIFILTLFWMVSIHAQGPGSEPRSILISPGLGMRAGAVTVSTLHHQLAVFEDQLFGTSWMPENTVTGKLVGIAGRSVKFAFLDLPVDYFSMVFLHEWYGHGSRYRELGLRNIDYGYDWPPPYGEGGGWASYNSSPGEYSTQERLGIWIGGMESEQVLNRTMRERWMLTGSMHYRESWLYFWSLQNILTYIADALDLVEGQQRFNDPQAYIYYLNADNGYHTLSQYPYTMTDLKKVANLGALDPFFWIAIYNNFIAYIWGGNATSTLPVLHVGEMKYLPSFHVGLTPFGIESYLENYLIRDEVLYLFYGRWGENSYHDSWGGIGGLISYPFASSAFSADLKLDLWKQPPLRLGGEEQETGGGLGGALSLRAYYRVPDVSFPLKVVMELGYKGAGFLEGYPLDRSPLLLFGVQL